MKETPITDKPVGAKVDLSTAFTREPPLPPDSPVQVDISESAPRPRTRAEEQPLWWRALTAAASLRLTVVLFFLSFLLVFWGTLAQVDKGIWTVVEEYFRCFFVMIPVRVLSFFLIDSDVSLPFPGGWALGFLLMTNLLAAHAVRFKFTWKRSGILVLHFGIVLMMVGEFITGVYQVEGYMTIPEGQSTNFIEHEREPELAIVDASDPKIDDVAVISRSALRRGAVIASPDLPFEVQVAKYMVNSSLKDGAPPAGKNLATAGFGLENQAVEQPEVSGVGEQKIDHASAYVTLSKDGKTLDTYLVSYLLKPQKVKVADKEYQIALRPRRSYRPFAIELIKFWHDRFMGVNTPKNFSSEVRVVNSRTNEVRETIISMNSPLRYGGEAYYQASFLAGDSGTILQVVRNPGWLLPYLSCGVVCVGMLMHFGMTLMNFLQKRVGQ